MTLPGKQFLPYNSTYVNGTDILSTPVIGGHDPKSVIKNVVLDWGSDTCYPGCVGSLTPIYGTSTYTLVPPTQDAINANALYFTVSPGTSGQLTNVGVGSYNPLSSLGGYYLDTTPVDVIPLSALASNQLNAYCILQSTDDLSSSNIIQLYAGEDGYFYFQPYFTDSPACAFLNNVNNSTIPTATENTAYAMIIFAYGAPVFNTILSTKKNNISPQIIKSFGEMKTTKKGVN